MVSYNVVSNTTHCSDSVCEENFVYLANNTFRYRKSCALLSSSYCIYSAMYVDVYFNPYSTCTDTAAIVCTLRACVDVCSLTAVTGDCRGYFPSYFYNHTSMRCERFIYGGCGGNQNRFSTAEDCYRRCNPSKLKVIVT